jgi:hypothetical protein
MLFVVAGSGGLVKTKGTAIEHLSDGQVGLAEMQDATVRLLTPTAESATSNLIDPSGRAVDVAGTHAGPVSL